MSNPNEKQIDGDHYRASIQHWDVIGIHGIGYLEGCATKYVTRHKNKNGLIDLEKAGHYVEKMLDLRFAYNYQPSGVVPMVTVTAFCAANDLGWLESAIVETLLRWDSAEDLERAHHNIMTLLAQETALAKGK